MTDVVDHGCRRAITLFVAGLGLLACIESPEFHQVDEGTAPETVTTTPASSATPERAVDAGVDGGGDDDDGDDATNYVPDGGMAGPGAVACGGQICAVGRVCCSGKCKNPKSKC